MVIKLYYRSSDIEFSCEKIVYAFRCPAGQVIDSAGIKKGGNEYKSAKNIELYFNVNQFLLFFYNYTEV